MKIKYNVNLVDAKKELPHMYSLPKPHKTPSKTKLVVTAAHCSEKPLSEVFISEKCNERSYTF